MAQVDQALAAAGGAEDLRQLKCDLEELVSLTEGIMISKLSLFLLTGVFRSLENSVKTCHCSLAFGLRLKQ